MALSPSKPSQGQVAIYDETSPTGFRWVTAFGLSNQIVDEFTPTADQTVFTLSATPVSAIELFINGIQVEDFTVAGNVLTYGASLYALATTDFVKVIYYT